VEDGQLTRFGRTVANSQNSQLPRRRRSHPSATFFRGISTNRYPAIDLHLRYPVNNVDAIESLKRARDKISKLETKFPVTMYIIHNTINVT